MIITFVGHGTLHITEELTNNIYSTIKNNIKKTQNVPGLQKNEEDEGKIRRHPRKIIRIRNDCIFKETIHTMV